MGLGASLLNYLLRAIKGTLEQFELRILSQLCDVLLFFAVCLFTSGFVKVMLYTVFLAIMIKVHTFPLFAIRPMYLAMR